MLTHVAAWLELCVTNMPNDFWRAKKRLFKESAVDLLKILQGNFKDIFMDFFQPRVLEKVYFIDSITRSFVTFMLQSYSHDYVKKYLGESKVQEALDNGANGKDCSIYYSQDVCPWDTSAMIKIASKIVTSGNIDFASIATAAAANLMKN